MELKDRNVLVTGGEGFIGSHLVEKLVACGSRVRVLRHYRSNPSDNNLQFSPSEVRAAVQVHSGDVQDPFVMQKCMEGMRLFSIWRR